MRGDRREARTPVRFRNVRTGRMQTCRMEEADLDDPIMRESGCAGEFAEAWRRRDRHDGCPACVEAAMP